MVDFNHKPNGDQNAPQPVGGLGGLTPGAGHTRDTRLVERALREGWPIKRHHRRKVVDYLESVIDDGEVKPREGISAARALMAADRINQLGKAADHKQPEVHNQQINIYLPDNSRGGELPPLTIPHG